MQYNWQQSDWAKFTYDLTQIRELLLAYHEKVAYVSGVLVALPEPLRAGAVVDLMTMEALKTSEIEGEIISRSDVKSSIRNNLGLNPVPETVYDLRAIGLGEMMAVVRKTFAEALTREQLCHWHHSLLSYRKDLEFIGAWRQHAEPMQIVSGPMGREKVHFEAPPSEVVPEFMEIFINWFNDTMPEKETAIPSPPVRAAIAHLYFESIHPFEDGNGRIGRAIAEKALSQGLGAPVPFSLSKAIESDKKSYYQQLEQAQRTNELTRWVEYFVRTVLHAVESAEEDIVFTLRKARFFERFQDKLNERQLKVVRRMLKEGPEGFTGGMNARKYCGLTGVSKATATRDLQHLQEIGVFLSSGGGRSTRYELNLADT